MAGRRGERSRERPEAVRAERLRLLGAMAGDRGDEGVLLAALTHATAELGGLGGMAHLYHDGVAGGLHLVASTGLPRSFTRAWEYVRPGASAALARAGRSGQVARSPLTGARTAALPGAELVAAPLTGPRGPLGVLSLLLPADAAHGPGEREFLTEVARWAAGRLRLPAAPPAEEGGEKAGGETGGETGGEAAETPDPVGRALRQMSDGFLAVERDGRIAFANAAAERLLGAAGTAAGAPVWELPALRGVPGLEEHCREAMAGSAPAELDVPWPDGRWYRLRLVPVPDGLTLSIGDITDRRRHEAERQAAVRAAIARAALMEQLTRALTEAITTQNVVAAVADSVLPAFHASGLIILAVRDQRLHLVGAVGYDQEFLDRLPGTPYIADSPTGEALRTRTPLFFRSTAEIVARHPEVPKYPVAQDRDARVFLPLIASGHVFGIGIVSFSGTREFTREERTLLTALSSVVAQALERARLYDAAATRARELQRHLLPRELPDLPAVTAAARYLPAEGGADVGGDWYDIIPLSADRVALVIGDVMGHGISEAATMGRLRTAVRTLSELELPPDDILDRLNDIVNDLGTDYFVTCLYGVYDPVSGDFTHASAGHPPPAVAAPDGTVAYLTAAVNPPLGAATPPFDTATHPLPDGALLVLYTDGLVEAESLDVDAGMALLARTLTAALREATAPDALCDGVTGALLPSHRRTDDDAALLIARTSRLDPADIASWDLPDDPRAAGQAREHVRRQLAAWQLGEEVVMTTELLASELIGNVVRHAKGPMRMRLLRSRTLICEVSDGSLTTPHIRRTTPADEGGRGLQLIAALSQRWGTRYTAHGKSIWTEQPIPAPIPTGG
ncbi:SpoIIE family protein phosphatase [Actinomadura viridis]|uniref:SpoIIE family protein phosphatase n=1 Tax=Actinomadura viridis TaxID=58110 RepID=UPI00368A8C01